MDEFDRQELEDLDQLTKKQKIECIIIGMLLSGCLVLAWLAIRVIDKL